MCKVLVICSLAVLCTVERVDGAVKERPRYSTQTPIDEDRFQQILSRVETLEKRDKEQQAEIDGLRSELRTEKQRTSRLEGTIARLRLYAGVRGGGEVKFTSGEAEARHQEPTLTDTEEQTQGPNIPSGKDTGAKEPRIRRQAEVPVIAFHATLTSHQQHTGIHQSVAFDNVITNIGNAYNNIHGNFNAPVSGVYVFSTTILGYGNNEMACSVIKNGQSVAHLWMKDSATHYDSDSATVVLHLNKGDDVAVENEGTDKFVHGGQYSMFSGFLLHEDESSGVIVGK